MPITGPASYLPTTDAFLAHWASANTALGAAGPIEVLGGEAVGDLQALRTQLQSVRAEIEGLRNEREGVRFLVDSVKAALLERLNQFNLKMRSIAPNSKWESMLPKAYTVSEGMGRVIPPLDDVEDLWERYEDEESPVTLMGAYTLTLFKADLVALKAAFTALSSADNGLGVKRGERTELENRIQPILKAYRQRIPAEFAEGSAIMTTLPRLSPAPGSTPEPVVASGAWDAAALAAALAWTESDDGALASYEVRGVAGPEYDAEDESVVATILPGSPRSLITDFALGIPGGSATYKVYVISETGNERGSNAVTITRPV